MQDHKLVSRDEWLVARKEHLEKEEVFHTYPKSTA
jgi:predicted dithiol-disulfide oxidoreductase (DUF899 family)